jgi:hypothetical protein
MLTTLKNAQRINNHRTANQKGNTHTHLTTTTTTTTTTNLIGINKHCSLLSLNINDLNSATTTTTTKQSNKMDAKTRIHLSAVSKKHTSPLRIDITSG